MFINLNASYSSVYVAKVMQPLGFKPDKVIACQEEGSKEILIWGFNEIKDHVLGNFTSVHIDLKKEKFLFSGAISVVHKTYDDLHFWHWSEDTEKSHVFKIYGYHPDDFKKEFFHLTTYKYNLTDRDDVFIKDVRKRQEDVDAIFKTLRGEKGKFDKKNVDDIDAREYFIKVLGLVKIWAEQDKKTVDDKSYKFIEEKMMCKKIRNR
tara:strand:- start:13 stop:633 length:621 start_codon:yes stop_codon:yes gene_type:complete